MPTLRPTRRRSRKPKNVTPAELQYLTGETQAGANRFELLGLELPTKPKDFERIDALLSRAAGVVPDSRIRELRADLEGMRTKPAA